MMTDDDIIRMTRQIAGFFEPYGHEAMVDGIAGHIRNFWDPRMRADLQLLADTSPERLLPTVIEAAKKLAAAG
jgi:formate dehydrogenase subunit delta